MPATLGDLLANPRLGLRLLTGPQDFDTTADGRGDPVALRVPISWVATSELTDPTPYLEGAELLLTTGLRLPRGRAQVAAYVGRLLDAGVVGLGYGVGLATDAVPATLVRMARERGLPLLEVPEPTPFIAIGKAVSDLLAADRYAEVTRGFAGQQALTREAVTGRAFGVVRRLAGQLHGWAALLSPGGRVQYVSPASARDSAGVLTAELDRLRSRRPAALSLIQGGSQVVVQPLASAAGRRGFLAVGTDRPLSTADRSLVDVATALLSFDLEQVGAEREETRAAAVLRLLLDGARPAPEVLAGLGGGLLLRRGLRVSVFAGKRSAVDRARLDLRAGLGDQVFAATADDELVAVTASRADQDILLRTVPADGSVAVGTSRAASLGGLVEAIDQARQAAAGARHRVPPVLDYRQMHRSAAVNLVDLPVLAAYADGMLGPLDEYHRETGIDLVGSLAGWLEHHGQYDPAATALRIHRHTLRYRVQKAEALLGRDLGTVDVRMELWFAITARQRRLSDVANHPGS
ncbi:PucR family transcriptional regulator [Dactylosporangium sp. NPDC051484]|uniref:PucR family transcriptional regulator n=1 Tax=Dactylosporangium sp. NPDC051484 TaxID=3154942 RepID=UPI00344D0309